MAKYTVQDTTTGKNITFEWNGEQPPTDADMEEVFAQAKTIEQPKPSQPDLPFWEKTKAVVKPMVRPALEFGGATVGGVLAAPLNIVAPGVSEALGVGGGYMIGSQAADVAEQFMGMQTPSQSLAGAFLKTMGKIPDAIINAAAGPATKGLLQLGGKVLSPVLGRLSGTGTGAVTTAVKSGEQLKGVNVFKSLTPFDEAMRGKISGQDVVQNTKNALGVLKEQRLADYQAHLSNITGINPQGTAIPGQPLPQSQPIDMTPIKDKVVVLMRRYGVKIDPVTREIDTSRIAMGKSGRNDIEDTLKDVMGWGSKQGDDTVIGLDTLKRRLDDFYSDSSQARQFVESLRNTVKDTIVKAVPEYGEMTKGYAEITGLIKDIESGLMLRKQGISGRIVADQTLRRLMSAMKDNFALRKDLVNALSQQSGEDLMGQIAGYTMRSPLPIGLAGTGPTMIGEAALAKFVSPYFYPVLAASSPRLQGEFLRLYGKGLMELAGAGQYGGRVAAYGVTKGRE